MFSVQFGCRLNFVKSTGMTTIWAMEETFESIFKYSNKLFLSVITFACKVFTRFQFFWATRGQQKALNTTLTYYLKVEMAKSC